MNSPEPQRKIIEVTELAEKDLDLAFALVFLGEERISADNRVWGAFIKNRYDQQTAKRLYARMFISYVESVLFKIKSEALEADTGKFSHAELALLAEKSYDLSDKGEPIERTYFGKIERNLKFAFRAYAKAFVLNYEPDYSSDRWQAFQQVVKIRNRITHPKNSDSMIINDEENKAISKAHDWFLETYHNLLGKLIKKLEKL
jgi:hypothetical protein